MPNRRYNKGRAKEYRAMEILRKDGFHAIRSAGSHGAVDVIAAKSGKILLIQVKSGKARIKKDELKELVKWAEAFNGEGQVWHFRGRGNTQKRRVFAPDQGDA